MDDLEHLEHQSLDEYIALATTNTDESWAEIDQQLSEVCNDSSFLAWARSNTDNAVEPLRDLAATILEASDAILNTDDVGRLQRLMQDEGYPGFRATCALAKRIEQSDIHSLVDSIRTKLQHFMNDPGVSGIANRYLTALPASV